MEVKKISMAKNIMYLLAFVLVIYCIYTHAFLAPRPFFDRGIYLGISFILFFLMNYSSCKSLFSKVVFGIAVLIGAGMCIYMMFAEPKIIENFYRASDIEYLIIVLYTIAAFIVMFRTQSGKVIGGMAILGLLYLKFGHIIPGIFSHKTFTNTQIATMLLTDVDKGALGFLSGVVSRILSIFFIFSSLLVVTGLGDFIHAVANYLLGNKKGGPAKIAVITSGLFGMMSGSPVANVAAVGSFTIPLMKRIGYDSETAASIEAIAASGGGLMPPVMGLGAFLMAEIVGVSYITVCLWGIIPAFMWYWTTYWIVEHNAWAQDLKTWRPQWKETLEVIKGKWLVALAVLLLLVFLVKLQVAEIAALWGVIGLIVLSSIRKGTRLNLEKLCVFLEDFTKTFAPICILISLLGIFISSLMSTGAHIKLGLIIFGGLDNWLLISLIVSLLCVMFGMIVPIIAAYLAVALIAAPILINFGFPVSVTHMFVFYVCALAPITPPVALAVFTASSISGSDPMKTGWRACKMALPLWFVPFIIMKREIFFAMSRPVGEVILWSIAIALGIYVFTLGAVGNFRGRVLNITERSLLVLTGLMVLQPLNVNISIFAVIAGVGIMLYILISNKNMARKEGLIA